jgi:hypothetical protein
MLSIRPAQPADLPVIWALSVLPNVGETADPSVPFPLPPAPAMPSGAFGDLDDPAATFVLSAASCSSLSWTRR